MEERDRLNEIFNKLFEQVETDEEWKIIFNILFKKCPKKELYDISSRELPALMRNIDMEEEWKNITEQDKDEEGEYGDIWHYSFIQDMFVILVSNFIIEHFGEGLCTLLNNDRIMGENGEKVNVQRIFDFITRLDYDHWDKVIDIIEVIDESKFDLRKDSDSYPGHGYG